MGTPEFQAFRRDFNRRMERAVAALAREVLSEAEAIISKEAIDTGDLLGSGEVVRMGRFHWRVKWSSRHALPVEFGSRPHWPPFAPILGWVQRNLRVRVFTGGSGEKVRVGTIKPRLTRGTVKARDAEVERVARAVQASIAKRGTKPVRFATRAVRLAAARSEAVMQRAFLRVGRVP